MELGVDFGTTRTVVASVDRGNYPVVSFTDDAGDSADYFPSLIALTDTGLVAGFDALTAARTGAPVLRSMKRILADPTVTNTTTVALADQEFPLVDLMAFFLTELRHALATNSSVAAQLGVPISAAIAVPAHAHSAQRLMTLDAFRRAGFNVLTMLNEPSAAAFEYTHRQPRSITSQRTRVVVYDLGGGTFDASLVNVEHFRHEIEASLGINRLGGDDFDQVLAEVARTVAGSPALSEDSEKTLAEDCQDAKEHLSPQTKRIALEVGDEVFLVSVADFYAAATPLVERTVAAIRPLLVDEAGELGSIAGIYLVGGGSCLPLVPRILRASFGRRIHRSPYPAASTAIGLALAADPAASYQLTDRLSRGFGVFREGFGGARVLFDPILDRQSVVSTDNELVITRRYRAAHNVGWFRFVEYSGLDPHGNPQGELMPFGQVLFPFAGELQGRQDLAQVPVTRTDGGHLIEERYVVDQHQIISVTVTDLDSGYFVTSSLSEPDGR